MFPLNNNGGLLQCKASEKSSKFHGCIYLLDSISNNHANKFQASLKRSKYKQIL